MQLGVAPRIARFALNRLGYGPRPGSIDEVLAMGIENWIEGQLLPAADRDADARVANFASLGYPIAQWVRLFDTDRAAYNAAVREYVSAHFIRAVHGSNQLVEVLTDFWFNHFNVFSGEVLVQQGLARYELDAIRPHVLGQFRDLLGAVAGSWAMMTYLDNYLSTARNINENYARELMELHTLGVDGGYTQRDVEEVSRAFTGWGIDRPAGAFLFRASSHDNGVKTVLGQTLPANQGRKDGFDVLDILARHPSTARFVSLKLCRRFVSDDPPDSIVSRVADAFTRSNGDLARVMRAIVGSPEFWAQAFGPGKLKTPHEFAMSALRAIGADVTDGRSLGLDDLGQPTFLALDPTGWSDRGSDWIPNPGSHLARMNFALRLLSQTQNGISVDLRRLIGDADSQDAAAATGAVNWHVFGGTLPSGVIGACAGASRAGLAASFKAVAVALASPAFQVK
jgi:uncharacterized protein (DUF1800 family)